MDAAGRVTTWNEAAEKLFGYTAADALGRDTHDERWDGTGDPHGLAGEAIPLVGRIVALADVFDALTNDRPYKAAWSVASALAEIELQRGRQFDPALTDAFLKMIRADEPMAAPAAPLHVAS